MSVLAAKGIELAGKTVMSGIQPTGVFHIGNLLGAVQSWVDMNNTAPESTKIVYMVADLHALTVAKPREQLRDYRWKAIASILASGISPERSTVYFQSQVPGHAELHWVLSSVSSMGYLNRMVQWKSKSSLDTSASINNMSNTQISNLNLALFSYPTLQAADILIHRANFVPVGDDQSQHLELARHVTQSFNHRYGHTFDQPATVLTPHKKILSLRDSTKKMSKSDSDQASCVYITDTADTIRKKLRKALTDSVQGPITYDPENRPAVANLLLIGSGFEGTDPEAYIKEHRLQDHVQLKDAVTQTIQDAISPIREKYLDFLDNRDYLESVVKKGAEKANETAAVTLKKVYEAIGMN